MGETFVFNVAEKVLGQLGSFATQEVCLAWGVESELDKLKSTISTIQSVLLDAEEKQAKNHQLRNWLGKLKDALYDADDVLDEFQYEALRSQVVNHGCIEGKVRNFFSCSIPLALRFKTGHKINEIRGRLDTIKLEKDYFHLTEQFVVDRHFVHKEREITHSFELPSEIIARDNDKEHIVQLLMAPVDGSDLSVIPIVGIGGLGKTALTKLVYNDERVVKHFDLKMWVCVSDDFDVTTLMKEIIKSAELNENHDDSKKEKEKSLNEFTIDELVSRLRSKLVHKKFVLILDDVWNEDREKWLNLRKLLGGADGSKLVVTTRSQLVASCMGTIAAYNLSVLSYEDSLSLFVKLAFEKGEETWYPNLIKIGEDIVKKTGGVPLAIRTLGSLLYSKKDESDWLRIRDNDIWQLDQEENNILKALKLSYDALPLHLKQCFSTCSLFPKDHLLCSYRLIPLWIAEGLINSSNENEELEDIGLRHFKELWSRCFFQEVVEFASHFEFKMHDLVHDLALSVSQSEFSNGKCVAQNIPSSVRHVSFSDIDLVERGVPKSLLKLHNLRTIMSHDAYERPTNISLVKTCISSFKYIRVLYLVYSRFEMLPPFVGNLKHLRYLSIAQNKSIKVLPSSICKLLNLQTLDLSTCLRFERLPRDVGNLISLRQLSFSSREKILPEGIGCLKSLRCLRILSSFHLESLGAGMQRLTTLQTLVIFECQGLKELAPHGMRNLTMLKTLYIWNCPMLMRSEEDTQGLKLSLRRLEVDYFRNLVDLPQWILGSANTLQYLSIKWFTSLSALPEWLQDFTSLQTLLIRKCPKLLALPKWMPRLTALTELKIENCPSLMRRCQRESGEDWPIINRVPKLSLDGIIFDEEGTSEWRF